MPPLTIEQYRRCRLIAGAGLATYTEAVAAFERRDGELLNEWNLTLATGEPRKGPPSDLRLVDRPRD